MPIIAMNREIGSFGKDVARGLGEALGIPAEHHEIIDHLADRTRVRKSHVVSFLEGSQGLLQRLTGDQVSLGVATADEICSRAAHSQGAVLRGWGAIGVLRGIPHVVRVNVCAPRQLRIERMLKRLGTDDLAKIGEIVDQSDEAHGAVMRRHFDVNPGDPAVYDIVLNTERVSIEQCVDEVLRLVNNRDFAETDASRKRLADLTLSYRVRAAVRASPTVSKLRISVRVEDGRATLEGIVDKADDIAACERVAAAVPGVASVNNELRPMYADGSARRSS